MSSGSSAPELLIAAAQADLQQVKLFHKQLTLGYATSVRFLAILHRSPARKTLATLETLSRAKER